jgi:hypothetical protein
MKTFNDWLFRKKSDQEELTDIEQKLNTLSKEKTQDLDKSTDQIAQIKYNPRKKLSDKEIQKRLAQLGETNLQEGFFRREDNLESKIEQIIVKLETLKTKHVDEIERYQADRDQIKRKLLNLKQEYENTDSHNLKTITAHEIERAFKDFDRIKNIIEKQYETIKNINSHLEMAHIILKKLKITNPQQKLQLKQLTNNEFGTSGFTIGSFLKIIFDALTK